MKERKSHTSLQAYVHQLAFFSRCSIWNLSCYQCSALIVAECYKQILTTNFLFSMYKNNSHYNNT